MSTELPDAARRELLALLPLLALPAVAGAQDATRVRADSYRVAFENSRVRVLEYTSRPGMGICGRGMHSHPAHLTVTLTPGRARVKLPDGTVQNQPEMPAGTVFWSEAETHEVENVSGRDIRALLIELKA
jgi:hypothetical protein